MFKKLWAWVRKNRKAVIVTATIVAITGTVAILLIKGKKVEIPVEKLAEKMLPDTPPAAQVTPTVVSVVVDGETKTFPREAFIRHLHEGWKASPEKLAQAAELGIDLQPGETLVDACTVTMKIPA